jgi:hypothetical protein
MFLAVDVYFLLLIGDIYIGEFVWENDFSTGIIEGASNKV